MKLTTNLLATLTKIAAFGCVTCVITVHASLLWQPALSDNQNGLVLFVSITLVELILLRLSLVLRREWQAKYDSPWNQALREIWWLRFCRSASRIVFGLSLIPALLFLFYYSVFFGSLGLTYYLASIDNFKLGETIYSIVNRDEKQSLITRYKAREAEKSNPNPFRATSQDGRLIFRPLVQPAYEFPSERNRLNTIVAQVYGEESLELGYRLKQLAYSLSERQMFEEAEYLERALAIYEKHNNFEESFWIAAWLAESQVSKNVNHPKLQETIERSIKSFDRLSAKERDSTKVFGACLTLSGVYKILGNQVEEKRWRNKYYESITIDVQSQPAPITLGRKSNGHSDVDFFLLPFTATVLLTLLGICSENWALNRLSERLRKQLSGADDLKTVRSVVNQLTTLELYRTDLEKADYYSIQLLQISNASQQKSAFSVDAKPRIDSQKIVLRPKVRSLLPWEL